MTPVNSSSYDPIEALRDGGFRLQVIYYLAIGIICILVGRLWFLQVMSGGVFAERADANHIRILPIPAPRGIVLDRNGKVLVTNKTSYNVVLSRKDVADFNEIAKILETELKIDRDWLEKRFRDAIYEPKWESIVVKELATPADAAWVESHQLEYPMIRVEKAPQRHYVYGQLAAHALGYVGEVSPEELKKVDGPFSKARGYKLGDVIGKFGIERTYNDILMGQDGQRRVLVDSRGRIQKEIESIDPIPGRTLFTTLDLQIQLEAESQGDTMPAGRGAIAVMDPNNGEILSMVSRPAFDPNLFSQAAKTPEGKEEISNLYTDEDKPLYNRVIQGAFPPGSTWKLLTTVASLNEGAITPTDSKIQDGGIQLGNYFMNSMSHEGFPDVHRAILRSCDGYYYRLGLRLGIEKFERWVGIFRFGQRTGIDLPNERSGIPPLRATKIREYEPLIRRTQKELEQATDKTYRNQLDFKIKQLRHESEWTDYDMAASAFGQGRNASTPIQLLRYTGGLANGGYMNTPHLLLRSVEGVDRNGEHQPEIRYEDKNRFQVPMSAEIAKIVKDGMWGAVQEPGGTAGQARVEGFDVCAKTGTAQVASKDKAGSKNKDHAWIISFAPKEKPEICSVVLTENAGFGGTHSAPRARAIYEEYYRRTRDLPPAELAKTPPAASPGRGAAKPAKPRPAAPAKTVTETGN
jgi:penicillin-binding protein 2